MNNLAEICGSVSIHIECQYDAGSRDFKQIPEMLDDMAGRGIQVDHIAFTPILQKRGGNEFPAGMGDAENFLFLMQEAAKRGLSVDESAPSNACMADFRSTYVFDTDGTIIPCPSLQGGEKAYGNVFDGIDFVKESQLLHRNLPPGCLDHCELLPMCAGGCRLQALIRNNDFNGIDCHYDHYSELLNNFIRKKADSFLSQDAVRIEENAA